MAVVLTDPATVASSTWILSTMMQLYDCASWTLGVTDMRRGPYRNLQLRKMMSVAHSIVYGVCVHIAGAHG